MACFSRTAEKIYLGIPEVAQSAYIEVLLKFFSINLVHPDNGILFTNKKEMNYQAMKRHGGTLMHITN